VVRRIPAVLVPVMARLPRWRPRWRRRRVAAYNPSWRGLHLSLRMSFRAVSGLLSMEDWSHSTGSHAAAVEQLQVCRRSTHFSRRLQRRRCGYVRRCGAAQETAEHVSSSGVKIHGLRCVVLEKGVSVLGCNFVRFGKSGADACCWLAPMPLPGAD
jgi:hypothetical protein